MPVRDMEKITGHAVRGTYLFCGMADVAALKRDSGYTQALSRLWDDVVYKKMYIIGRNGTAQPVVPVRYRGSFPI